MAIKRRKSLNDIGRQNARIYYGIEEQMDDYLRNGGSTNDERYKQLERRSAQLSEMTNRYAQNIFKTKSYKRQSDKLVDAVNKNDYETADKITRDAHDRQYSSRTYMGKTNG